MDILYDIIGYEGLYKINKNGEVWSCRSNKFLKAVMMTSGYLQYYLCVKYKKKQHSIHRLLGIHFIPNPDNLPEIDHIDRNKLNNNLDNLRWCSRELNQLNKGINKTNKSGHRHISTGGDKGCSWCIFIGDYNKCYAKSKYTLEQVVAIRNEKYIEFGLEIRD
jgi:hypothetical protein